MKSNPNKTIIKIKEETAKLKAYFENKNPEMLKDEYIIKYFQELESNLETGNYFKF